MTAKLKIKKGDKVIVIAGRDRGRTGEVLRVAPNEPRLFVQGVHMVKRHTRQKPGGTCGLRMDIRASSSSLMIFAQRASACGLLMSRRKLM